MPMYRHRTNVRSYEIDRYPERCPFCGSRYGSGPMVVLDCGRSLRCQLVFQCGNADCGRGHIAVYREDPATQIHMLESKPDA